MKPSAVTGNAAAGPSRRGLTAPLKAPGTRRLLQLILAAIWLLDAMLQYKPFMFTSGFSDMLAAAAQGNPAVIAQPMTWNAGLVGHHLAVTNATFATIQLLIALGIAFRPTVKAALAASIAWSLGVWWFGEGLGGVLAGTASPVMGAPGSVIIYALLAVLLWPADRTHRSSFVAGLPLGALPARLLWLVLWGSLAYLAVQAVNRTSQGLHDLIAAMASGEPGWLAAVNRGAAALLAHHGLQASIALAVMLAIIATGVFLPTPATRTALVLAIAAAVVIWIAGQDLGGIFTGSGTDPNSGPLLALLAVAYWPARTTTGDEHAFHSTTCEAPEPAAYRHGSRSAACPGRCGDGVQRLGTRGRSGQRRGRRGFFPRSALNGSAGPGDDPRPAVC